MKQQSFEAFIIVSAIKTRLADLYIPGEKRVNPQAHTVSQFVATFCQYYHVMGAGYAHYTSMSWYLYPRTSQERLESLNILMNVLYYIDDEINIESMEHEDPFSRELFLDCLQIFRIGQMPRAYHTFYDVWQDLHNRFISQGSQETLNRIIDALTQYLQVSTLSYDSLYHGDMSQGIDLEEFIEMRLYLSGMYVCTETIEFAYDIVLPEEVRKHPTIVQLGRDAAFFGAFLNDIFSYHKEALAGNRFNLVAVLMEQNNYTIDEAIDEVVRMLNVRSRRFEHLVANRPAYEDDAIEQQVQLYIQGLEDLLIASWHWQNASGRYQLPELAAPYL